MHKGYYQEAFRKNEKEKIDQYIDLATTFNKTHNLFVRKDKEEIYNKDILDCLPIIKLIKPNKTVADLGSGGGLPGILLSITKPKNKITLIESNQKKCYFLRSVVHTLDLKNTTVLNKKLTKQNKLGVFDIITARALATAPKITQMSEHLLAKNGKFLLLKGALEKINEEVAQLDNNTYSYTIHRTNITHTNRHILEINPK